MNLPNKLTVVRVLLVPIFMLFLLSETLRSMNIALAIFILASITDFLDGYIARSQNLVTKFGKFMDPLADKLLVCSALICLQHLGKISPWFVMIIIAREFAITGFRILAASDGITIAASNWGKLKTNSQMLAIIVLLLGRFQVAELPLVLLAVALTIISGVDYIVKNKKVFAGSKL